jgi:hypothetical protein
VGRGPTFQYGESSGICPWACPLQWPSVQTPTESAFLHYTGKLAQIQKLRPYIYFHLTLLQKESACSYCFCLPVCLTCAKYPAYQSAALPFTKLSRTYISTVLSERFFTRTYGYTKKVIKLFHKFIESCSLMHVHSPRENQSSNRRYQFLQQCRLSMPEQWHVIQLHYHIVTAEKIKVSPEMTYGLLKGVM